MRTQILLALSIAGIRNRSKSAEPFLLFRAVIEKYCFAFAVRMFIVLPLLFNISLSAEVEIFNANGDRVSLGDIERAFRERQVLILGEEHNDKIGHEWKFNLIREFSHNVQFSISMEMLERDQQIIINEYLQGLYDEIMFRENMRLWNNWSDYHPILEFGKKYKLRVLAANPPRRYVRALSRRGLHVWNEFSPLAYLYLPNLEFVLKFRDKNYEEKFLLATGISHTANSENLILAQHVWDESMAEVVTREITLFNRKVIHINGRFHSDNFLGVTYRLKQRGVSVITVSIIPESILAVLKDWKNLADFIVLTKP